MNILATGYTETEQQIAERWARWTAQADEIIKQQEQEAVVAASTNTNA